MDRQRIAFDRYKVLTVRFVPYGPAEWSGLRRLDFWQYSSDRHHANQIWLGHDDETGGVTVGTFDPADVPADSSDLAEEATGKLVSIGLPDQDVARPDDFGRRLINHAMDLAARRAEWPTTPVTVDGNQASLRFQVFADRWAGIVDGHPIAVYGFGNRPIPLTLVRFADTTPYGFDVTAGVRFVDMRGPDSWRWPSALHPDHLALP